jgi:hypothetical protein
MLKIEDPMSLWELISLGEGLLEEESGIRIKQCRNVSIKRQELLYLLQDGFMSVKEDATHLTNFK